MCKANANLHFKNSLVLSERGLADYLLCLNRYLVPKLFHGKTEMSVKHNRRQESRTTSGVPHLRFIHLRMEEV